MGRSEPDVFKEFFAVFVNGTDAPEGHLGIQGDFGYCPARDWNRLPGRTERHRMNPTTAATGDHNVR
jgi:hypothetical protein